MVGEGADKDAAQEVGEKKQLLFYSLHLKCKIMEIITVTLM